MDTINLMEITQIEVPNHNVTLDFEFVFDNASVSIDSLTIDKVTIHKVRYKKTKQTFYEVSTQLIDTGIHDSSNTVYTLKNMYQEKFNAWGTYTDEDMQWVFMFESINDAYTFVLFMNGE